MAGGKRRGLTLLELILALGLAALILYAVSMAIDFHLRALDVKRANVEEAQVARAVLQMIANDLRSTVREYRMDTSAIEQMLASATGGVSGGGSGGPPGGSGDGGGAGPGGNPSGSGQNGGNNLGTGGMGGAGQGSGSGTGTGGDQTGGDDEDPSATDESGGTENTEDLANATTLPPTPGLYGNQTQLQLDVSRLPRADQYQIIRSADQTSLPHIPSDVKTVTYYVQDGATTTGMVRDPLAYGPNSQNAAAVGLVRREVDRAVVQFAQTNGTSDALLRTGDLIAPEVTSLQFQYFDGLEWLPQWDSAAKKGLPVAIEILMEVMPAAKLDSSSPNSMPDGTQQPVLYRLVVNLPQGEPVDPQSTSETDAGLENLGL